jgi:hypothetical protein
MKRYLTVRNVYNNVAAQKLKQNASCILTQPQSVSFTEVSYVLVSRNYRVQLTNHWKQGR